MKILRRSSKILLLGVGLLALIAGVPRSQRVDAGGPLFVSSSGRPLIWGIGRGIPWTPDQGNLGRLTNSQAISLVSEAFQVWQNVPITRVKFRQDGQLSQDITASNVMSFLDQITQDCVNEMGCVNAIIFDTDGRIIEAILGRGASRDVLGFAGPTVFRGNVIRQGRAVLNGRFGANDLRGTMIHEFGHLMGLDHSQLNSNLAFDSDSSNDEAVPTMFPFITRGSATLHWDDMAAVGYLYPSNEFNQSRGQISGQILLPDGKGFQGANVIAREIDDPLLSAVTSVSGFLHTGTRRSEDFGVDDPQLLGFYQIVGLPPGRYTVEVEEIIGTFTKGSGVGPLDPPAELPGPPEFYSGDQESDHDDLSNKVEIEVMAESRIGDINIILNVPSEVASKGRTDRLNENSLGLRGGLN